jgi:hypothetical protein
MTPEPQSREVLDVADVMVRYGLRDRRAARRLMDAAGAFMVGNRLLVRRDDLLAYEDALRAVRRPSDQPENAAAPRPPRRRRSQPTPRPEPLRPGWWRSSSRSKDAA